jgi:hypothetical protein
MITQLETGKHAVIDVNYFPSKSFIKSVVSNNNKGYWGFPDFDKVLLDFLLSSIPPSVTN